MAEQTNGGNNNALPPLRTRGNPTINTVQQRGGFFASCKAFFARVLSRGNRQRLSTIVPGNNNQAQNNNGVIAAPTKPNRPTWFTKLIGGNPNKRRRIQSPFNRKHQNGKKNSINIGNIGRPNNKTKKVSQAPPSEHVDYIDVPELLRKESTTIIHGHGRAYDSVANPSIFVNEQDMTSLRAELSRVPPEKNDSLSVAQQKFRNINQGVLQPSPSRPNHSKTPPVSPVESPKQKPRDEVVLNRFSLASSIKSGTNRDHSEEKEEYLQDLDAEPALVPIDRTPAMKSLKRRSSQKKTREVMLPEVGEVPQRQAVSADAATFDNIRVASADKFKLSQQPHQRALSADSFPIPLGKQNLRTSENTQISVQSEQLSNITPVTMLHQEVSEVKTTLDRNKKTNKGLFASFMSGSSRRVKKKKGQVLSSGEDPVNILASRSYQETLHKKKKKKKKPGMISKNTAEDQSHLLMSPVYAKTKARKKKKKVDSMNKLSPEDI